MNPLYAVIMNNSRKYLLLLLCACALFLAPCSQARVATAPQKATIINPRCEYLESPLGIDSPHPRFTWEFKGKLKNFVQQKYEVRIALDPDLLTSGKINSGKTNSGKVDSGKINSEKADSGKEPIIWTSGSIESGIPQAIYTGSQPLQPHTRYYWNVSVWSSKGTCYTSEVHTFETGKMTPADWQARWITDANDREFEPAPLFRKEFTAGKPIVSARAYISATAYYEMFINGTRAGNHYLDPGYTHYDKRILYVTHDLTSLLAQGTNAVAVALGNGFYNCQSRAVWDFEKARWRDRPRLLCELRLTYADGTVDIISTNDSWKTHTGPYTYNNIYSGDRYDARLEEEGWNRPAFDDRAWTPARLTTSPAPLLVAQQMPPIRSTRELKPVAVRSFGPRIHVFDLGENIAGVCRLRVKGEAGTTFTLRHGELLKTDGRLEPGNIDVYYRPEKPGEVFQTDVFTLKGSGQEETFTPQFTYHGFRYVEVTSDRDVTLTTDNLTGLFLHTDLAPVGQFTCSNPLLNKIWKATDRSYRGNIHSIPTDCPQREKNGWTADAHIAIDLALLMFDGITLYEKWMNDFIDNQRPDGCIAGIVPSDAWGYGEWPGPVWDAALFIIPNALYNYYGDKRSIERLYPTMLRYLDYLKAKEKDGILTFGLGDWVFYKSQTPVDYTSTVYYYLDYRLMERFTTLLGKDASHYRQKAEELKRLINQKFFDPVTGIYANGTQTAQAIALYAGIVPSEHEQPVADNLHKTVAGNNYFLDFGLLGSKSVPAMLAKYGYIEDAYRMVTKTEAPSWGYWVETQGYTTLAETWTLSPKFHDASLNHVFMGDVSAWMMQVLAGINHDSAQPGFSHIVIRPYFPEDLQWVKGEYRSVRGLIRSEWKKEGNRVTLVVEIPVGATATVYANGAHTVGSGVHRFKF